MNFNRLSFFLRIRIQSSANAWFRRKSPLMNARFNSRLFHKLINRTFLFYQILKRQKDGVLVITFIFGGGEDCVFVVKNWTQKLMKRRTKKWDWMLLLFFFLYLFRDQEADKLSAAAAFLKKCHLTTKAMTSSKKHKYNKNLSVVFYFFYKYRVFFLDVKIFLQIRIFSESKS